MMDLEKSKTTKYMRFLDLLRRFPLRQLDAYVQRPEGQVVGAQLDQAYAVAQRLNTLLRHGE